jgi:hypothetical protein
MDKFTDERQSLLWGAVYVAKVWHGAAPGEAQQAADAAADLFAARVPDKASDEDSPRGRRR